MSELRNDFIFGKHQSRSGLNFHRKVKLNLRKDGKVGVVAGDVIVDEDFESDQKVLEQGVQQGVVEHHSS